MGGTNVEGAYSDDSLSKLAQWPTYMKFPSHYPKVWGSLDNGGSTHTKNW